MRTSLRLQICLATSPYKWLWVVSFRLQGESAPILDMREVMNTLFWNKEALFKGRFYSAEYPNELSRVAHQCGSRQRRPVTLFSLVLLSFVALLVVDSQGSSFLWLHRRKNMTFIPWPKPPKPSAFIYGKQLIGNLIPCLSAYHSVPPGRSLAPSKMDAENSNLSAWGICLFVRFAVFKGPQTTGECIQIQSGWIYRKWIIKILIQITWARCIFQESLFKACIIQIVPQFFIVCNICRFALNGSVFLSW